MTTNNTSNHNDEIDLKEVFRTILRYKISIIIITFVFLVASTIFAYYKPNVYSVNSTVQILEESNATASSTDFMMKAFGGGGANIENEVAVIESRFIVQKALESLNLSTNYFSFNKLNKKTELYKYSPFIVNIHILEDIIYSKTFELIPKTDDTFRLIIHPISPYSVKGILQQLNIIQPSESDSIVYDKVHKYAQEISTPWFTFTVDKINYTESSKYHFNFIHKSSLFDNYIGGLSVSAISEFASVLSLSYEDNVSLRAKEILNAISQSYIYQGIEQKTRVAELTLGFIDAQLDTINTQLKSSASNLEKYKVKNDVINLGGKADLASTKLIEYEALESEIQTEINILNNLKLFIYTNEDLSGLTVGTINFADSTLGTMVATLQKMSNSKSNLLIDFTEIHPEVQKLTKNIASMKRSIKSALKSSLNQLIQRRFDLRKLVKKYTKSLESLPSQEKELASLSRPLNVNQEIYEYLLQKKAETAIMRSSTISNARVLDAARDNPMPIKPKRKLIVIVGLILGLIVGVAYAFLREFLIYTIQNSEEVERITNIPMYGVIPLKKIDKKSDKKLSKKSNNKKAINNNIFYEAFRNIRTNLQFLPGNEKNQIISITSSVSGEGKTTITAALSEILARGNKKVIVLDLDLRKASVHKEFNLNNNIGMSNYLSLQNTLEEVTKETSTYGLEMITTGPLPPNPSELILSPMFTELLDRLREKYDYIVMDTPPAGLVTDAIILMNYSDISFAVVRAQYTRKEFVKNIDRLSKEHANNKMGIILNGTQMGSEYGYGYGASYAYGYGNSQYYKNRG